jgi:hypothetical protein
MSANETVAIFPHVCIIESPSPGDLLQGQIEGDALSHALLLGKVRNNYYRVDSTKSLEGCFEEIRRDAAIVPGLSDAKFPMLYLHFSAHGNTEGIGLTNGDFIRWCELGDMLIEFADRAGRILPECPYCAQIACFSACEGIYGAKMANRKQVCPFVGIIGPPRPVTWADSLTSYVVFYHNTCHKDVEVAEATRRMNAAIGQTDAFVPLIYTQLGFPEERGGE